MAATKFVRRIKFGGSTNIRVTAFTGGTRVPSARFRVRQLIPALRNHGISVREYIARLGQYPPRPGPARLPWGAGILAERAWQVWAGRRADVVLLQRELVSRFVTWEPLTRRPRILDVDDAIFIGKGESTARRLAKLSDCVICGNEYLANWFSQYCQWVEVLPTAVDCLLYQPAKRIQVEDRVTLGWIGTGPNLHYLENISPALEHAFGLESTLQLRVVCDEKPTLPRTVASRTVFCEWSAERESEDLQAMDIGLMPLPDDPWTKGKCALKMLQYMAVGIPVIASPVGVVTSILGDADVGIGAIGQEEWERAILELAGNPILRRGLGANARNSVVHNFSVDHVASEMARILRRATEHVAPVAGL